MKAILPVMILAVAFASVTSVQAENTKDAARITKSEAARHPGGGWDANNLRISVSRSKLIGSARECVAK